MASKKTEVAVPPQPKAILAEGIYSAVDEFYQNCIKNAEAMSAKEMYEVATVAIALVLADKCNNDLGMMSKVHSLKKTSFYKYRRLAASWGIDACDAQNRRQLKDAVKATGEAAGEAAGEATGEAAGKPVGNKGTTFRELEPGSFDDIALDMPEVPTLVEAEQDLIESLHGKDLEEQFELLTQPLPKIKHASPAYKELLLRRIE